MTDIEFITAKLAEIEKARSEATQGEWKYEDQWIWNGPHSLANIRSTSVGIEKRERNGEYIALSANEITKLTKALAVAVQGLDFNSDYETISEIREILK